MVRCLALLATLAAASALVACGGSSTSALQVVRSWSDALRAGDNERAASLFGPGAKVVQGSFRVLDSTAEAISWNASLPCTGLIVATKIVSPEVVDATFLLMDRTLGSCDGLGERVTVVFTVRGGRIDVFHQLLPPPAYVPQ